MTLFLAKKHLLGGFSCGRNSSVDEWGDRKIFFLFSLQGVLEARNCAIDSLKKECVQKCGWQNRKWWWRRTKLIGR